MTWLAWLLLAATLAFMLVSGWRAPQLGEFKKPKIRTAQESVLAQTA
jgi:hypothetical protein